MTIASPSSQQAPEETRSPSQSWGLALTGGVGSGKTTTARLLSGLLDWRVVSSGDVARVIDQNTARTGAMADADALDRALLPLLNPGPVILDGYPRTIRQLTNLPMSIDVVFLRIDEAAALDRIVRREKFGWNETQRIREQRTGLEAVERVSALTVDVDGKTPGEVVFEILSSKYLGPPIQRAGL